MALSVARKRFARRLAGYATNPVRRRVREALGREQVHDVGGLSLALPPGHDLPFYQRRDPTYDRYAEPLLASLAADLERMLVIDVGANVGDTALLALSSAPNIDVRAVEGSETFLPYLHRNLTSHSARSRVFAGFAGPLGDGALAFGESGSTGRFGAPGADQVVSEWVTPAELLADAEGYDRVVWKSDIDGFDLNLLVAHWETITARCDTLWLEWDPVAILGPPEDADTAVDLLASTGRPTLVFDNLGRHLVELPPGRATATGLASLSGWLRQQRSGHLSVPYLDVWSVPVGES